MAVVDATEFSEISTLEIRPEDVFFQKDIGKWCQLPYPGHPKGCPNYGKSRFCPPHAPVYSIETLKQYSRIVLIFDRFNFTQYKQKMADENPKRSDRQNACCLYWQSQIKKEIKKEINNFKNSPSLLLGCGSGFKITMTNKKQKEKFTVKWKPVECYSMEAVGINVIKTLKCLGIPINIKPTDMIVMCSLAGFKHPRRSPMDAFLK